MSLTQIKAPSISQERERELVCFLKDNNLEIDNLRLLNLAFTHTSYANECKGESDSYERLEFLGDSILDMITAEYLFENYYAEYHEGDFTKIKAVVVSEDSLSEIARQKHFEKYILIGKGEASQGGATKKAIQADVMEAVIAAVFLDKGLDAAREYVLSFIPFQIEKVIRNRVSYKDYKTKLQEYWQKKRERNIKHDQEVTAMFEARGWTVLRIWECELKTKNTKALLERFQIALNDEQLSKTNL